MIRGMILTAVGIVLGVGGSLALGKVLESLLFGVKATNAFTLIVVSLGLVVVALVACYVPAHRATKVNPLEALRYE
jgi:putative ABC transport system permease protein